MFFYNFLVKDRTKIMNFLTVVLLTMIIATLSVFFLNFVLWMSFKNLPRISFANTLFLFTKKEIFPLWLFNAAFLMALQFFIMIILRKFWVSEIIYGVFIGVIGIAEYFKIQSRNEPILPGDLTATTNLTDITTFVPKMVLVGASILAVALLIFAILYYKHDYTVFPLYWENIIVACFILLMGHLFINRPVPRIDNTFNALGDYTRYRFDATLDASTNGIVVSFANNLINDFFQGNHYVHNQYSEERIRHIVNKYKKYANKINESRPHSTFKGQTVIYVLSETYTRPANIPHLKLDKNPTPFMDQILHNNLSGHMVSAGYGGGTANMEWMADTGMSYSFFNPQLQTPFIQVVPQQKRVPAVSDMFQEKIAIHPFLPNYYNRPGVFKKLGYQAFYSKNDLQGLSKIEDGRYYSDEGAYNNTLTRLSENKNKSQYIELITMQNHMPYATTEYKHDYHILAPNETSVNRRAQESYIQGLHYTDDATWNFLNSLNQNKRPITVVFYGDHWPGIYQFMPPVGNRQIQTHMTDYFIYQNDAAKKKNGTYHVGKNKVVAPNEFTPMMLQYNGMKVSPYYALLTRVHKELPAIAQWDRHPNNIHFVNNIGLDNKDNNLIDEQSLTKKQKKLLHEYELIQYDLSANHAKQYSVKDGLYKLPK